jgi:hypothetical protein
MGIANETDQFQGLKLGCITFKGTLKVQHTFARVRLLWLRMETGCGLLFSRQWSLWFHIMQNEFVNV